MEPTNPLFLNGLNRKWHTRSPQWTKENPLCLTEKSKFFKNIGSKTEKEEVYLKCPCKDTPFKYKSLTYHKKSSSHILYYGEPVAHGDWYTRRDIVELIKVVRKAPDTAYNAAKLKRLEYIKDNGHHLCKCGSAYKQKSKSHVKTDIHKTWVSHGSPCSKVVFRVRGFTDLYE